MVVLTVNSEPVFVTNFLSPPHYYETINHYNTRNDGSTIYHLRTKTNTDANGLPPATQTGTNTLGFLLNGQPWSPQGQIGVSANLTVNVDFGYNKGVFGISAYKANNGSKTYFGLGIRDSLNFISIPSTILLTQKSLMVISFSDDFCSTD